MTRNEAAERLRTVRDIATRPGVSALLDEALAAERRATVERIAAEIDLLLSNGWTGGGAIREVRRMLDEEAAR